MNIFTYFEAHKNPLINLMDRISSLEKLRNPGLKGKLISLAGLTVAFILPCIFTVGELVGKIYTSIRGRREFLPQLKRTKEMSVIIVNWNGEGIIPRCLESLEHALSQTEGEHEVIVVDNNSSDRSVEILKNNFPWVKVIKLTKNVGFARGNNAGVKAASKELVVLLNNDIFVEEDTFTKLLEHYNDNKVFAVAPRVVLEDGSLNEGHSWGEFDEGILRFYNERQHKKLDIVKKPALTLYPIGACAVFDKEIYLHMGGLDNMLSPFYWEDDDLGYRALKRGYKVIYDPRVSVVHKNAASSARLSPAYIRAIKEKNMLLFMWKNLTHKPYFKEYLESISLRIDIAIQRKEFIHIMTYVLAFLQAGEMMRRRIKEMRWTKLTDKEALTLTRMERQVSRPKKYKPNILLVTPFPPYPPNNGGAIRIYNLTKQLKDRFDFTLVSFIESQAQTKLVNECRDMFKDIHLVERKYTPHEGLMKSEIPNAYTHYISSAMASTINGIIKDNGIDICQVEFPWMAYYGKLFHNKPTVFVEHDVGNMFYGQGIAKPGKGIEHYLSPFKAINYESAFIDSFDKVVTVTDEDKEYFKTLFPDTSVTAIEQGVDTQAFQYQYVNNGVKNLVYLGHYKHYPNEDAIVHFVENIFPLIQRKYQDVKLHIVGSHPTRRINRLKVREDIVVTGSVPEVADYLKKGTVFIAPIRLGRGLKGKLLEAMALGLPVVASPVAAAGIGAREGEEIFIASTPEQFADNVSMLLSDRQLRDRISRNGRKLIEEKFDWKVLADKMESVYRELV